MNIPRKTKIISNYPPTQIPLHPPTNRSIATTILGETGCLSPYTYIYIYIHVYDSSWPRGRANRSILAKISGRPWASRGHLGILRRGCIVAWYLEISRLKRAIDRISKGSRRQRGTPAKGACARLGVRSQPDQSTCIPPGQLRQPASTCIPTYQSTSFRHYTISFSSLLPLPSSSPISSSSILLPLPPCPVFVHSCVFNVRGEREKGREREKRRRGKKGDFEGREGVDDDRNGESMVGEDFNRGWLMTVL